MATAALIPVEEYLTTSYEPDVDFVDGVLEERAVGELDHGELQLRIASLLSRMADAGRFKPVPEYRLQVTATRFRVPDVCLLRRGIPREQIGTLPPMLCVEILSPEDRMSRTMVKVRDYLTMGVPEVWVVDPENRSVLVCNGSVINQHASGSLVIPTTGLSIDIAEIFSVLDED